MRLTIALLGLELDLTFGPATAEEAEDEAAALNGGTLASTPISFVGTYDVPADLPWVERDNGWGDEDE